MESDERREQLIQRLRSGSVSRKVFLAEAAALGMSMAAAQQVLAAAPSRRSGAPVRGGTLVYGYSQPVTTIDVSVAGLQIEDIVTQGMLDRLIWRNPNDSRLYPGLAKSVDVSPDVKTYTFHLRNDVMFHDGTPFNAAAVKYLFDRIVDPKTKSGAGVIALGSYDHTEVVDDYTCKVVFKQANSSFLVQVSSTWLSPQSPTAMKKYGLSEYPLHITGTGPYMLKEWVPGDHLTVVRNPNYKWQPSVFKHQGPPYLDSVIYRQIPSDVARVVALQSNQVNLIDNVPAVNFGLLHGNSSYKTYVGVAAGIPWDIGLNVKLAPTNELAVRQAIEYAVDQKQIASLIFNGTAAPAYSLLESNTLGYSPQSQLYHYNPAKANQLLESAGWKMGSGGIRQKNGQPLKILSIIVTNFGMDGMATVIQQQLKAVGIDMVIQSLEAAAAFPKYSAHQSNMAWQFYVGPDPSVLGVFWSKATYNTANGSGYISPRFEALLQQAEATVDTKKQAALYRQANEQVLRDAVGLPLVAKAMVLASSAKVALENTYFTVSGNPNFYDVYIQP